MFDEGLLDDTERLLAADRSAAIRAVAGAGAQVRHGAYLARQADVDRLAVDRPRAVVVLASGPAALAGDALAVLASPAGFGPVLVTRDSDPLPSWTGVTDVVCALSHSGTESGVLAALDDAARRGAWVLGIGPPDTPLHHVCARARGWFLPSSGNWPAHAALWPLLTPLLLAAGSMGLVSVDAGELDAAADQLDAVAQRCQPGRDIAENPAKELALALAGVVPVLWGTSPLAGVAARRFAGQLAQCAATAAVWGVLPGVAAEFGGVFDEVGDPDVDLFRDRVGEPGPSRPRLVVVHDPLDARVAADRAQAARRSAQERGVWVTDMWPEGTGPVERFASLVSFADFVSVYLGLATGVDPAGVRTGQDIPA